MFGVITEYDSPSKIAWRTRYQSSGIAVFGALNGSSGVSLTVSVIVKSVAVSGLVSVLVLVVVSVVVSIILAVDVEFVVPSKLTLKF